jgi:3-oxoacyl-[acyl-carrier protein] reductase
VLINNAGLGGEVDVVDMTDEQWFRVLDVTLNSVFRMSRAFPARDVCAKVWRGCQQRVGPGLAGAEGAGALCRRQGRGDGLHPLFRSRSSRAHNVRINAVAPSIAMHAFLAKVTTDELLAELSAKEAFGRPAEVWEVANVMMFLASDLSSYMTGEVLSVSSQRA